MYWLHPTSQLGFVQVLIPCLILGNLLFWCDPALLICVLEFQTYGFYMHDGLNACQLAPQLPCSCCGDAIFNNESVLSLCWVFL